MKKMKKIWAISIIVLLALGVGLVAASASNEAVGYGAVTAGIINPDGTTTQIKTFEGSGFLSVNVTKNDDGSITIVKEDKDGITVYTFEAGNITAETLKPSERIDVSGRTVYYRTSGNNVRYGLTCGAASDNVNGYACAEVADGYANCWRD